MEFDVRNDSHRSLAGGGRLRRGYHLFDADSGTLIVDGARVHPERDIAPGEARTIALDVELPPEDGRYRAAFAHARKRLLVLRRGLADFLVLDANVKSGATELGRLRASHRTRRAARA